MKRRAALSNLVLAAPANRLGLVRIVIGGYTLWYLRQQRGKFARLAASPGELFAPVGAARVLNSPLPAPVAARLVDATVVSSVLFTLGFKHRLVGPVHAALLAWTLSYRNSWSMIFHSENTLVWHTLVLGAARAADGVSLDALWAGAPAPGLWRRYGWPLQVMQTASAVTYLLSGVAKVAGPAGWGWARGNQMRRQVAIDRIYKDLFGSSRGATLSQALYPRPALFTAFAVATLILELGAPAALAHPKLARAWAGSAFGMHWGIRAIMGIRFRYQLSGASFAPWLALERILPPWTRR